MIKRYSNRDDALATLPLSDRKEPLRSRDRFPPHALILYLLLFDRPAMLKRNLADLLLLLPPPFRLPFLGGISLWCRRSSHGTALLVRPNLIITSSFDGNEPAAVLVIIIIRSTYTFACELDPSAG